jgi:hypothetical protein
VARFLTDDWIAQMDHAAGAPGGPRVAAGELVVQHVVTDLPPALDEHLDGEVERAYHVELTSTSGAVRTGRRLDATVTFTSTYSTAAAIASGATSAQAEFMAGRLRLGGAVDQLLAHHGALAATDDVFTSVRAETEY